MRRGRSPHAGHEPGKAGHGDCRHGEQKAEGLPLAAGHGTTAGCTNPTASERGVRLAGVQAKGHGGSGHQLARAGGCTDARVGVVDVHDVLLDKKGLLSRAALECTRVPGQGSRGLIGHVGRQGPSFGGGGTRYDNVDCGGSDLHVCVVPAQGDKLANPVEGTRQGGLGCQYDGGAGWVVGIYADRRL